MENSKDNILIKLRSGANVVCPLCHEGFIIPFVLPPDKAHDFNCSNEKCNNHYHYDYNIDIE